jgi:hypothetical protein
MSMKTLSIAEKATEKNESVGSSLECLIKESVKHKKVWSVRDEGGFPAPKNSDGKRSMPFWSLKSRAEKIVNSVPAYHGFEVEEIN